MVIVLVNQVGDSIDTFGLGGQERRIAGAGAHSMLSLTFAPDGKSVVTHTSNGQHQVWDAATGKLAKQLPEPHQGYNFVTSPDGRYVAVWDQQYKIFLVDNATGAGDIVDQDGLAEQAAHALRQDTADRIGRPAGRGRDDHGEGT